MFHLYSFISFGKLIKGIETTLELFIHLLNISF